MALKTLLSFSSGEIDPILFDYVTLEKFKRGLATARNVTVGKTGTIMSRFPRAHFVKSKNNGEAIRIYSPPNSGILCEFGGGYVRFYNFSGSLLGEAVAPSAAYLPLLHFQASKNYLYVFTTAVPVRYNLTTYTLDLASTAFRNVDTPNVTQTITPTGAPTGYQVDYAVSYVYNGEEYNYLDLTSLGTFNKPEVLGQSNAIVIKLTNTGLVTSIPANATELRVYRRPNGGGAFGFIGASTSFYLSGSNLYCKYIDVGGDADFTNGPPLLVTKSGLSSQYADSLYPATGLVYQQRLLIANFNIDVEGILASRPGFQNNFDRDFPYDADSALQFKAGTSGKAAILRMVDSDGLVVFTEVGVFVNTGLLNIDNVVLDKRVNNVIEESIAPLAIPGGVFFVDKTTNSVRQFLYSQEIGSYQAVNQSIFSDHLFKEKVIVAWDYQGGSNSIIIAVFSDGTFATFTYDFEHEMKAWTRHDSKYPVEDVAGTTVADTTFFVTNKNGNRYIEVSLPRRIAASELVSNPEADKSAQNTFMDASYTKEHLLNEGLDPGDEFLLVPTVTDDWEDDLTLTCGTSGLFPAAGLGAVGTIFRFFDTTDKSTVDLEVVSRTSDDEVVVKPSCQFPSAQASGFRLYETFTHIVGLAHLEGENVTVVVDGFVVNSPNNDVEGYDAITVSSGAIDLPASVGRGAIIIVGRPITADIKTLNITTLEEAPTTVESLLVGKLYVRVHESRGLFVSNKFPEEADGLKDGDSVVGMEDLFKMYVPDGYDITGNRYLQPISRRIEQTLPGDWDTNGQMSFRQVDPVHFEILSIIPDVEIQKRSDV